MASSTSDGVAERWPRGRNERHGLAIAAPVTEDHGHQRPRDWRASYVLAAALSDALCAVVCVAIAYDASSVVPMVGHLRLPNIWVFLASPLVWVLMVAICHGYERRYLGVGTEEYRAIVSAAVRLLAIVIFVSYAFRTDSPSLSRLFVLISFPGLAVTGLLARLCVRKQLHRARWHGRACHRTVVVGRDWAVEALITDLEREPVHGLQPVAACPTSGGSRINNLSGQDSVQGIVRTARRSGADVVIIASPSGLEPVDMRRLSWKLDDLGIELIVSPGVIEVTGPRLSVRPAANLSLLHIERPALRGLSALYKSTFDRVTAGVLLVLASPLFLAVAVLVKLSDGGEAMFRQQRIGANGRAFTMLKFRTMVPDAEDRLLEVRAADDHGNGMLFKRHDDPRVTRVGRVLRRYSIDELPQLINVVCGDMSLVGPRPPLRSEVDGYGPEAVRRLRVRPGLTGLWQVSGRSDLSWDESLRLDLRYVDNWSLMLDLQILWRTVRAVTRGKGAY